MNTVIQLIMDYTLSDRLPRYLDQPAWDASKALEAKNLAALRDGLSEARLASLDRLLDAWEATRGLELQASFLAAFSIARELYAG